jgi:hypothetical protein
MNSKKLVRESVRCAAIEALESRQLMSVTIPANAVYVPSLDLTLNAKGPSGPTYDTVNLARNLEDNTPYFVVAEGKHQLADSPKRYADAQYYQPMGASESSTWGRGGAAGDGPRIQVTNPTLATRWQQNTLDAAGSIVWNDSYATDHKYAATFTSGTADTQMRIIDSNYKDNADTLKVKFYKLLPTVRVVAGDGDTLECDPSQNDYFRFYAKIPEGSYSSSQTVRIFYTLGGDATAGVDYDDSNFGVFVDVTIPASGGEAYTDVLYTPIDDDIDEFDESINVGIAANAAYFVPAAQAAAAKGIRCDDYTMTWTMGGAAIGGPINMDKSNGPGGNPPSTVTLLLTVTKKGPVFGQNPAANDLVNFHLDPAGDPPAVEAQTDVDLVDPVNGVSLGHNWATALDANGKLSLQVDLLQGPVGVIGNIDLHTTMFCPFGTPNHTLAALSTVRLWVTA